MDFMGKRARFVCGFVILDCGLNWGVKGSSVTQALTLIDWTPQKTSAFAPSAADKRCSFLAARFVLQALLSSLNKFPVSKHGHYIMTYTVVEEPLLTTSKCNYSLFTEHKYIN